MDQMLLVRIRDPKVKAKLARFLERERQQGKGKVSAPPWRGSCFGDYPAIMAAAVRRDPFVLLRHHKTWTFANVDHVAELLGVPRPVRARRLVLYVAKRELTNTGGSKMDSKQLRRQLDCATCKLTVQDRTEAYIDLLEDGTDLLLISEGFVSLRGPLTQEQEIFRAACCQGPRLCDMQPAALSALAGYDRLALSDQQERAVVQAFGPWPVSLVTGNPGCGKSACCDAIAFVAEQLGLRCHFVAFTWLAAQRINQVCQGANATSIHKYVYSLSREEEEEEDSAYAFFDRHTSTPASASSWGSLDLLVLDEASMAGSSILHKLVKAVPRKCRLLMVGDENQLTPIDAGQPFADLVRAAACALPNSSDGPRPPPWVELSKVFRTDKPRIMDFAAACRQGRRPEWLREGAAPTRDFAWYSSSNEQEILQTLTQLLLLHRALPDPDDCQVLVAGKAGPLGLWAINALAARLLRPQPSKASRPTRRYTRQQRVMISLPDAGVPQGMTGKVESADSSLVTVDFPGHGRQQVPADCLVPAFVAGDKVMFTGSNHPGGMRNGQRGVVTGVSKDGLVVTVNFFQEGMCAEPLDVQAQQHLQLAYAITVHKYQGSEAGHAIVLVMQSHAQSLKTRNLLYTAATRARNKLSLFADSATLDLCLNTPIRRSTCLGALLNGWSGQAVP